MRKAGMLYLVIAGMAGLALAGDEITLQLAIDGLPATGGVVRIPPGIHLLQKGLKIHRSHVALCGEAGSVLRLADKVDLPVVSVGCGAPFPTNRVEDVRITNLEIDGNQAGQTSETDPKRPWIRNNGIDVRAATGLVVDRVRIHSARSGGLVVSWDSSNVVVTSSVFDHNYFDGIALYASEAVRVAGFNCRSNQASGLSFDNRLMNCEFRDGVVADNTGVGIFVRDSRDLMFSNVIVRANGTHGAFLAHDDKKGGNTGVYRLTFDSCVIEENKLAGFWLASPAEKSPGTVVTNCHFRENGAGCFMFAPGARLTVDGRPLPE